MKNIIQNNELEYYGLKLWKQEIACFDKSVKFSWSI